jgi:hypothetical protein
LVTILGYQFMLAPPPPPSIYPTLWMGHKLSTMIRKNSSAIPNTERKYVY